MMDFISAHMLRARTHERLKEIAAKASPKRAMDSGAATCQRSGVCCWTRPCDLFPGDEQRIADHLGVAVPELFRSSLVVDNMQDGVGYRVLPRRGQQEGGRYLTSRETFDLDTPCVFLDVEHDNACRIQPVKPQGGAQFVCTLTDAEIKALPHPTWTEEQLAALGWDGDADGGDW